jgi:hypothetical protein
MTSSAGPLDATERLTYCFKIAHFGHFCESCGGGLNGCDLFREVGLVLPDPRQGRRREHVSI